MTKPAQTKAKMNQTILAEYQRTRRGLSYPAKWALIYAKQWARIKELEADPELTIEIIANQDGSSVRGNAIASGDDDTDKRIEDEIIERLDRGDVWAWALVEVRVSKGGLTESDYLGGCSYRDEKGFKRGGYYYDMIARCLETINAESKETECAIT